ncbi:hypothetical protein NQ318_020398 [Aromia moschata]|uniref:PiggyBac transposable element-derived protein domain-containing protein n=1 Tax=Aromia moschata TaxID=1265417 RepID=A0AAV8Y286_9CUCU|nr:hypothetical protein NQ318_020398 [Aromia moschata]
MDTIFATDGTGRDIFRAVMSKNRFSVLLSALRFDDPTTRTERKKENPAAAVSEFFNGFIDNCQNLYGMGDSMTIDEMLVSFRGRTHFKICQATSYLYNGYIYTGKGSHGFGLSEAEQKLSKPTQAVIRLAKPLFGRKKGKSTVLVSSMHHRASTNPDSQKPEIVEYYNRNKGGVDTIDEKYSTSRRTRRWPLTIFFRMLDASIINAYILHQSIKDNPIIKEKSAFAKELAAKLVREHMEKRLRDPRLPRELRFNIIRILGISEINDPPNEEKLVLKKRKGRYLFQGRVKHLHA